MSYYQEISKQDRVGLLGQRLFQHENDHFVAVIESVELTCDVGGPMENAQDLVDLKEQQKHRSERKIAALRVMRDKIKEEPDPEPESDDTTEEQQ